MRRRPLPLLKKLRYFSSSKYAQKQVQKSADGWSQTEIQEDGSENFYRDRWQHDKVVRTTHGVNCTGSCSWKVHVKNGIIAWETQATDYPSTGPDMPEYEPRGCPRGATFSWYSYSPLRVKYPYIRASLLKMWREELKAQGGNPIMAWYRLTNDPAKAKVYKEERGKGGMVRVSWEEVNQIMAASLLYTIQKYGPDRISGFTPIPAMSMVSYASGARFMSLLGGSMLSFYDWYADLPPASPQMWGEQTDVPESSDWYNSSYIIMWGSNVPLTRTPDAHFTTEVRYKGTKVVSVSPDYAESVRFADEWVPVNTGADGALAQAMTHVILKEFYLDRQSDYFTSYVRKYTDLPNIIILKKREDGSLVADRFLTAADLGRDTSNSEWKTVVFDEGKKDFVIHKGSIGARWEDKQNWNLKLEDEAGSPINPSLSLKDKHDQILDIQVPYFDDSKTDILTRRVPAKAVTIDGEERYVTTVFDLMLANYGVDNGLGGDYPQNYDDMGAYTPAWQEEFTGVPRDQVIRLAREFAQNAEDSKGRSMIIMGAGINHWYHADVIYRSILNLVVLTGCQGVNGGGWAHYVGQEKLRPLEGWQTVAFARDWQVPPRLQNATSYYYFGTSQWRYEELGMDELKSPTVDKVRYQHAADYNALAARLGWLPSYPQFDMNSLQIAKQAFLKGANGDEEIIEFLVENLKKGHIKFAVEEPDNPLNFPRALFVWRANLISSSGKGHDYFLKHLLGTTDGVLGQENPDLKTEEVQWQEVAAQGKLDLLVNLEFRMSGTAMYSDIVLPAATWYEKHDLSSTDMHPFIHPFNPAITPPWEAKSDWNIFKELAKTLSSMAEEYMPEVQQDIVAVPLMHDSPDELAQPFGQVKDWRKGEVEAIPGKTMPKLVVVERDYTKIYDKFTAYGELAGKNPIGAHGVTWSNARQYEDLKRQLGTVTKEGVAKGLPKIETARQAAEAILAMSSASNGQVAMQAWEASEKKTGLKLADIAEDRAGEKMTFDSITAQPRPAIASPVFTGSNKGDRRYSPFTTSIERLVPFRTLTGKQHFYTDHEIMLEYGEGLPVYKPTLPTQAFAPYEDTPDSDGKTITLRYLTPHGKWNIHSMYGESLNMLTLFRGGPNIWMNNEDAAEVGIEDNDWIEMYNRNGVVIARAVVSHRLPKGISYMYHAQDKTIQTPGTSLSGTRGGTHNSPTRIHLKPTHVIGGYAQFSYGFNYYGPTGNQRDLKVVIRKAKEVNWYED